MKKILAFALALFFFYSVSAQSKAPLVITPGVGIGKLKLGMSEKQAMAILKGDPEWKSYTEEMRSFQSEPVAIDEVPQFILGFDTCTRFNSNLPASMPVFSLYFLKHKLNYITVTSYSASEDHLKQVVMNKTIHLQDAEEEVQAKLGTNFISIEWGEYTDHVFPDKGIEISYSESQLVTIGIFPITKNYKQLQAKKSELLKKQMEELGGNESKEDMIDQQN